MKKILVDFDIDTIFREIVYVRGNAVCNCNDVVRDPQTAVNLYDLRVCASCGGVVDWYSQNRSDKYLGASGYDEYNDED